QGQFSDDMNLIGTRYDDGLTTDAKNSLVRICGGFASAPGASGHNELASGSISGTVFVDSNGNGVHDAGEPGIPNVTVTLTSGTTTTPVQSDQNGNYTFTSLPAGSFQVSSPDSAAGLERDTPSPLSVTLTSGESHSGVDFGYVPGSVAGFAYVDSNRNGVK